MYVYNRKMKKQVYVIATLSIAIVICCGFALFLKSSDEATLVMKEEDAPLIQLPDSEAQFILPFLVEAEVVNAFFDGSDHEVDDFTYYEGVYRANQGIDYAYNNENFDVIEKFLNMMSVTSTT